MAGFRCKGDDVGVWVLYVAGDTPTEDVLVTIGETTFHGVWVVVVVVVAGLLLNIGATDGLF